MAAARFELPTFRSQWYSPGLHPPRISVAGRERLSAACGNQRTHRMCVCVNGLRGRGTRSHEHGTRARAETREDDASGVPRRGRTRRHGPRVRHATPLGIPARLEPSTPG
eukprot:2663616-Prymnesium_polylepis.1